MTRTFVTATDGGLINMIKRARTRLALIAPAITTPVAQALAARISDLPALSLTIILDADAEVYRIGYGDPEALEIIRKASKELMFDLREQPGVRIGVVISDDRTMVYAPVSRNVEAGSTTDEKPNAIMLDGAATENLAVAAGASEGETEIGVTGMEPERVAQMQADLAANPPKPFDLTRRLTVFTSAVEFVDLKVSNYKLSKRRVPLPQEFVGVGDETLKQRISSQIRAPFDGIGTQKIKLEGEDAELLVDEAFIEKERKDIEDTFTYVLPKKGRVILKRDRVDFDKQITRFKQIVMKYRDALKSSVESEREGFRQQMLSEFSERWNANPPNFLKRRSGGNDPDRIKGAILDRADELFKRIVSFAPPEVDLNYKGIVIGDIEDAEFRAILRAAMVKARVDNATLDRLFQSGDAAAAQGGFDFSRYR
ncbi:hypothetical protein SAMN05444159_1835 [Bradyrhizobium lablabi]|uniref:Uncharacterized protein n=1 Tax=Bradyrhizobium lablabi TaxID=722472 RepID=A0A1M6N2E2_9BRAD|nr:hypothetical protein [Bradyrhizobium lablabi]SHJ89870.1 hypothetical protein SAMN05444159_1835 [Bradyrhizobium lablabi]